MLNKLQFKKDLMPYSSFIQVLDRLSVRSVLRGSTSTFLSILGTLAVFILCLAIYIPPTINYFQGNYFESEFWVRDSVNKDFYSNDDFKIAVQIRKKSDNSVANHTKILKWAYSEFGQVLADWKDWFVQPTQTCDSNYLADTINPVYLQDCFIFPQHKLFDVYSGYAYYTQYSYIFYWFSPKPDLYPFISSEYGGNVGEMNKFFKDYYYIVYFTSAIVDPKSGEQKLQVNRYYSTDSDFSENVGTMIDLIVYNAKNYTLDISIMPWINNVTKSGLIWLGQTQKLAQLTVDSANIYGVQVHFSLYEYNVLSYRYYKKLDWLLGIIGGAMLLFYIILWVPFNFINKTIHQMNNVNQLLLINHALEHKPITQSKVTAANVSNAYWFSNFLTKKFFISVESADKLVMAGQRQLDIIRFIKKIKVAQRSLNKKKLLQPYEPKVLKLKTIKINQEQPEQESGLQDENLSQEIVQREMIVQQEIVQLPTDPTFGITQTQMNTLKEDENMKKIYENNMTATIIRGDDDHTNQLKQMQTKNKYGAIYSSKKRKSKAKIVFNAFVELIRYFDFFGARPNLIAAPFGSSLVGFCGSFIIITLSILICALTIANANVPQFMILDSYQDQKNFGYSMQTGSSLKFALCFSSKTYLTGTNKLARLRFFTNSTRRGFEYILPTQLKSSDSAIFDLTPKTTPTNLSNCFSMEAGHEVLMGQNGSDFGYFGFLIEPYCSSTAAFCEANAAYINNNLASFINRTYIKFYLPQNRFDPYSKTLKNNLVYQQLNINMRFMKNISAYEETLFVDEMRIEDDTKNWFIRKAPEIKSQGIAKNQHTSYPITKSIPGKPYYAVNIKPSGRQIRYLVSTKKADTILASIGGIFILFYAIFHWIGKIYNTYNVKTKLAEQIYDQECISDGPIIKLLAISRLPLCMITSRFGMKYDVARARQVQKKINNDLNYLWLVKYVDNIFNLSSALFQLPMASIQAKNLSLVFVKQKIDESEQVIPRNVNHQIRHNQQEFNQEIEIGGDLGEKEGLPKKKYNKILNQDSQVINLSNSNIQDSYADEKLRVTEQVLEQREPQVQQTMQDNYLHGNPKQPRFNMLDTFEYPASLTLKGKREVTSFCGGCCCLIMTFLIVLVSAFQLNIYLNKSDIRVGMSTEMMQPLSTQSNSTYNSKLSFETGKNFKLAVTFSSAFEDYPHNVANWTSVVGISIFQQTYTYSTGKLTTRTIEYPLISCDRNYLKPNDPMIDPDYYKNTEYGYCVPDGISLQISGVPEDQVVKRFSLSIYNKAGTSDGNQIVKSFMQIYLPKIHFSSASLDFNSKQTTYEIHSLTFDGFNVTRPNSQNITFSKVSVLFDDQIAFEGDPYVATTYVAMPFQQFQASYNDQVSTKMSYNVSFANSYLVYHYRVVGNKFYETFGIIGGLVALFIFGLGYFAKNFNEYRMQYLIGKQLYLFDILKKKQAMAIARGRKRKTKQQLLNLSNYNDMNEAQILLAYILSFFAAIVSNYNINTTLRRVTLIQQRVIKDLNLFQVYKKIHNMRDTLNKHFASASVPLANIHLRHIYIPEPDSQSIVNPAKLVSFAKKHCWSSFEQFAVYDALGGRVNLKEVFDNAFLERAFNMQGLDRNSIYLSQFGGTQGSVGTASVVESVAEGEQEQRQTFDIE